MAMRAFLAVIALLCIASRVAAQARYRELATAYANKYCKLDHCGTDTNGKKIYPCICAEFVSRTISAGGCLRNNLLPNSPTVSFEKFMTLPGKWNGYTTPGAFDLAWVSKNNPRGHYMGLYEWLTTHAGWRQIGTLASQLREGCVIFGGTVGGGGAWTHTCYGSGNNLMHCHNKQHCNATASLTYAVTNAVVCPPEDCIPNWTNPPTGYVTSTTVSTRTTATTTTTRSTSTSTTTKPTTTTTGTTTRVSTTTATTGAATVPPDCCPCGSSSSISTWSSTSSSSDCCPCSSNSYGPTTSSSWTTDGPSTFYGPSTSSSSSSYATIGPSTDGPSTSTYYTTSSYQYDTTPPPRTPPPRTSPPPTPPRTLPPPTLPPRTTPPTVPPRTPPPTRTPTTPPPTTRLPTPPPATVPPATVLTSAPTTAPPIPSVPADTTLPTPPPTTATPTTPPVATIATKPPTTLPPATTPPAPVPTVPVAEATTLPPAPTPRAPTLPPPETPVATEGPIPTTTPPPSTEPVVPPEERGLTTGNKVNSARAALATVVGVGALSTCFLVAAVLAAYVRWREQRPEQDAYSSDSAVGYGNDNPLFKPLIKNSNPLYENAL